MFSPTRRCRLPVAAAGVAVLVVGSLGSLGVVPAQAARPGVLDSLLGQYIVTLRGSVTDPGAVARRQTLGGGVDRVFTSALKGYTASLTSTVLARVLADPQVKTVERDVRVKVHATEVNPPTGLDRIDQRSLPLTATYTTSRTGAGVRAYVIDSGVRADHPDFGGRVAPGYNVLNGTADTSDCIGHGTHVAGTLAGTTYGVAKAVTVIPVKTFGCADDTPLSAIIAGVDWVTADHHPGQPAVANLSLGGPASPALDQAVTALSDAGVAVAVAAGNETTDACTESPARLPQVLTVAASDPADTMAGFSNGGSCVALFAPGVRILSADSHTNGSVFMSGTSMATPHVTGALALEMATPGTTAQQAHSRVLTRATTGTITGTGPHCTPPAGCRPATPTNRLLYTG